MKDSLIERMNLQLFAEGGEANPPEGDDKQGHNDDPGAEDDKQGQESSANKKYTDEDVNEIVKKKIAEERSKAEEAVKEAEKLAKMNAEQKKDYELEKLREKVKELEAKENIAEMSKVARGMLSDEGITLSDQLLSFLVSEDADTTKSNIEDFAKEFKTAVDTAVTEKLKGKTPTVGSSTKGAVPNKKITEMTYQEQMEILEKDPELYQKLIDQI